MKPQTWVTVAASCLRDPAVRPPLAHGEVHIWRASQTVDPPVLSRLYALLDADEKARADRFIFQRDHDRFIVARGILRELLAAYIGSAAAEIRFHYGPQGKPSLLVGSSQLRLKRAEASGFDDAEKSPLDRATEISPIRFNMSHSHGLAAFAFAIDRELGIDIELIRPDFGGEEIAQRFFSRDEVSELMSLPSEVRAEAFFLCWTRKEAYIKGRGQGLQIPLTSFSVSLTPGGPEHLRAADASYWQLHSFSPMQNYAAALIAEAKGSSLGSPVTKNNLALHFFDWQP